MKEARERKAESLVNFLVQPDLQKARSSVFLLWISAKNVTFINRIQKTQRNVK